MNRVHSPNTEKKKENQKKEGDLAEWLKWWQTDWGREHEHGYLQTGVNTM